jgi:hypothetical protein
LSAVDLFAVAMWPLAALGLWLGRKSRSLPSNDIRHALLVGGSLTLIVGPLLTLVVVFAHHSATVMALEYSIVIVFGAVILLAVWRVPLSRGRAILLTTVGFLLLGGGLWYLGGDFLVRRPQVEGYVSDKRHETRRSPCTRCLRDYFVYVGGRRYASTARVFQSIQVGQRIRAKVGRASRRILWFEVRLS